MGYFTTTSTGSSDLVHEVWYRLLSQSYNSFWAMYSISILQRKKKHIFFKHASFQVAPLKTNERPRSPVTIETVGNTSEPTIDLQGGRPLGFQGSTLSKASYPLANQHLSTLWLGALGGRNCWGLPLAKTGNIARQIQSFRGEHHLWGVALLSTINSHRFIYNFIFMYTS